MVNLSARAESKLSIQDRYQCCVVGHALIFRTASKIFLPRRANQAFRSFGYPTVRAAVRRLLLLSPLSPGSWSMSDQSESFSELVEIAKRNGDFRRNYGTIVGAYLYLRSINATRGRSIV